MKTTISKAERDAIVRRAERLRQYCIEQGFTSKRSGWTCYKPEQVAHLNPPSNEELSAVEVFDFVHDKPAKYFVYVNPEKGVVTTWTGDVLGQCTLGRPYVCPAFNGASTRQSIHVLGINGVRYSGTFYRSSGDFARIKAVKNTLA